MLVSNERRRVQARDSGSAVDFHLASSIIIILPYFWKLAFQPTYTKLKLYNILCCFYLFYTIDYTSLLLFYTIELPLIIL